MRLLPVPSPEHANELLFHVLGRRSGSELARDLEGGPHLGEVSRAGWAREKVFFESNASLRLQGMAEVLGHELHHLFAHQIDRVCAHRGSPVSATCCSSFARTLARARCRSTRW